jgi:hypothetical protein
LLGSGVCAKVDRFLAGWSNLSKIIDGGLLFRAWQLASTFKLKESEGAIRYQLLRNPGLLGECIASLPDSCDHMRSALTLAQYYASAQKAAEDRCCKLYVEGNECSRELGEANNRCQKLSDQLKKAKVKLGQCRATYSRVTRGVSAGCGKCGKPLDVATKMAVYSLHCELLHLLP